MIGIAVSGTPNNRARTRFRSVDLTEGNGDGIAAILYTQRFRSLLAGRSLDVQRRVVLRASDGCNGRRA